VPPDASLRSRGVPLVEARDKPVLPFSLTSWVHPRYVELSGHAHRPVRGFDRFAAGFTRGFFGHAVTVAAASDKDTCPDWQTVPG
jgi:hypothetical protein